MKIKTLGLALLLTGMMTLPASAVLLTFQQGDANGYSGAEDTYIRWATGGDVGANNTWIFNWGATQSQRVSNTHNLMFIRFQDLYGPGLIPNGATINSASITFVQTERLEPGTYRASPLHTSLATYGTLDEAIPTDPNPMPVGRAASYQLNTNLVNWLKPCVVNDCGPLDAANGDYDTNDPDSTTTGVPSDSMETFTLDVTGLFNRGFVDGTGVVISAEPGPGSAPGGFVLSSDYAADTSLRPLLSVDYVPEPASLTLLALGGLTLLRRRSA